MKNSAKAWLRDAGHDDIATAIEQLEAKWKKAGKATRRDWWRVLAGSESSGTPCTVDGVTFPILRAVRERQGLEPVKGALASKKSAPTPRPARHTMRWPTGKK